MTALLGQGVGFDRPLTPPIRPPGLLSLRCEIQLASQKKVRGSAILQVQQAIMIAQRSASFPTLVMPTFWQGKTAMQKRGDLVQAAVVRCR